jgi:hypothetical protein
MKTITALSFVLIALLGVASTQAGTAHVGHTTVHTGGHGYYHGNYHGGYNHHGNGYYARGGQSGRYWHGGYYRGSYYNGGYYPYDSPFFVGIPLPFFVPGF